MFTGPKNKDYKTTDTDVADDESRFRKIYKSRKVKKSKKSKKKIKNQENNVRQVVF